MTNGLLFFFCPLEQQLIAVRPVAKALIDARDGRGRNADLLRDLREGLTIGKKRRHLEALRHRLDLAEGAEIVEEAVAFFKDNIALNR